MSDATQVSPEEWSAWRSFTTMRQHLDRALEQGLQAEGEISAADYHVLIALFEAPDRTMRARDLSLRIGWERSRLSHHLGRMERRGLVNRDGCPTDSRGAEIAMTPAGSEAFRRANGPHLHAIRELFIDALTPAQVVAAGEIAASLKAHLLRG